MQSSQRIGWSVSAQVKAICDAKRFISRVKTSIEKNKQDVTGRGDMIDDEEAKFTKNSQGNSDEDNDGEDS